MPRRLKSTYIIGRHSIAARRVGGHFASAIINAGKASSAAGAARGVRSSLADEAFYARFDDEARWSKYRGEVGGIAEINNARRESSWASSKLSIRQQSRVPKSYGRMAACFGHVIAASQNADFVGRLSLAALSVFYRRRFDCVGFATALTRAAIKVARVVHDQRTHANKRIIDSRWYAQLTPRFGEKSISPIVSVPARRAQS